MQSRFFLFGTPILVALQAVAQGAGLSPTDSLASLKTVPGIRVELAACEPQVIDPVAMAFDEQGRMYVVENRDYPSGPPEGQPHSASVALLEDTDRDGLFETRHDFAKGFRFPGGVLPSEGGVYVTDAPDLLYLKDTDGDGRADLRETVLTGFAEGGSTQLRVSHPTWGLDGWMYLTNGLSGGKVTSRRHPESEPLDNPRGDWRYDPVSGTLEAVGGQAQFGLAFDRFGRRFVCSNRKPIEHVVLEPWHLSRNPRFAFSSMVETMLGGAENPARLYPLSDNVTTADSHEGTFTAACGLALFGGTRLRPEDRHQGFICDPTGNLIHRMEISPQGATFAVSPNDTTQEFVASTDNWFRPVFLANGPDGALYCCDMYRKTIEHPNYLPKAIAAITDFESGKDRGRIYRIVADSSSVLSSPPTQGVEEEELVAALTSPHSWTRETARRLLRERERIDAGALLSVIRSASTGTEEAVLGGVEAFWLAIHQGEKDTLAAAFQTGNARLIEQALAYLDSHPSACENFTERMITAARHPDPRVRFNAALALAHSQDPESVAVLADIAVRSATDPWTRAAVVSSSAEREPQIFAAVLGAEVEDRSHLAELFFQTGALLPIRLSEEGVASVILKFLETEADFTCQIFALTGLASGLRRAGVGDSNRPPLLAFGQNLKEAGDTLKALIDDVRSRALDVALDDDAGVDERVSALQFLAVSASEQEAGQLVLLLDPFIPAPVELAAIDTLTSLPFPTLGPELVDRDRWAVYTPDAQTAVLGGTLGNSHQLPALLEALESEEIPLSAIAAQYRSRLLNHGDQAIAERSRTLFGSLQNSDRQKVYEDYKEVLALKPEPKNGREVFRKNCAQCHRLDGEGFEVGPDLFTVRDQAPESLLLHVLDPNYEMVPGYTNYMIETYEGETLTGLIVSETPTSLTLRWSGGEEATILRADILEMTSTKLSLMPEEIEKAMSRQDLRDLISYLKGEGVRKGEKS